MYIIIGLGNPSGEYKGTRHNIGFDLIDELAERNKIKVTTGKHKAICGSGMICGTKVVLAKPLTYMNLSGESVRKLTDFYKVNVEKEIIVIYDDVNLDVGQLRIRTRGSAGGHNGIKSIIAHLGTQDFYRIKIGVGKKPENFDLSDYVLGRFDDLDKKMAEDGVREAALAVEAIISEGIDKAMNLFNVSKNYDKE